MSGSLSIDDVLSLKYLNQWEWSPAGNKIAFVWNNGGKHELWIADVTRPGTFRRLVEPDREVTGFDWHPINGSLLMASDGDLWLAEPAEDWYTLRQLTATNESESSPSWAPDGESFGFVRDGHLWVRKMDSGFEREIVFPGRAFAAGAGSNPVVYWAPDGSKLVFPFIDDDGYAQLGVCTANGKVLWRTTVVEAYAAGPFWLDAHRLLYSTARELNTIRDYYLATFTGDEEATLDSWAQSEVAFTPVGPVPVELIYEQRDDEVRGSLRVSGTHPNPGGSQVLFTLENDGWAHLYLYDVESRDMRQVTGGSFEDYGYAGDEPQWSPDGSQLVFSSNRTASAQRQLWLLDPETGDCTQLTNFAGTNASAKWSPEGDALAFVHCDPWRNQDLWMVSGVQGASDKRPEPVQLTQSMPETWTSAKVSVPEEVVFKGAQDWDIHGFLFKPVEFDPAKRYPALVWVHGGPMRQMRYGFHPMLSYALFYAYHQYLAHRGYVSISLNFRGGIGYGRDFRNGLYHKMGVDDVADVVAAGRYLKDLDCVDSDRVAVWGLSYGGYMTLHALTQYPGEFRMGINLAGIWDMAQWTSWVEKLWNRSGSLFRVYLGGDPDESPELYRQASPVTFKEGLSDPLVNLHGTRDANVDFEQLDRIVKDCIELGHTYEAYYYPDEVHTFRWRRTWEDAFGKIERDLERYLKPR